MRLFETVKSIFVVRIATNILSVFSLVFFANELGAARFGSFVLFQALIQMLGIAVDPGLGGAIEKRISGGKSRNILGTALVIKAGVVVIVVVGIIIFQTHINHYLGAEVALPLIPVLAVAQVGALLLRTMQGELRVVEASVMRLLRTIVYTITGIVLVYAGWGIMALIASSFLSWIVLCLLAGYRKTTPFGQPTMAAARSLFDYSKYNFIASVVGTKMYSWLDTVLIGLFLTQIDVAAYEVAWRIASVVMLFSGSIATALFPQVSDWDASGNTEHIERIIPTAITGTLLFVFPAVVGATILGDDVLRFVFKHEYAIAATALLILLVGKVSEGINNVIGRILLGIDQVDLAARAVLVFLILNMALNILLIPTFGLAGAAVATATSFTVNTLITANYLSRFINIRINIKDLVITILASVGMSLFLITITRLIAVSSLPVLVAIIVLCALVYFGLLALSPTLRNKAAVEI